MDNETLVERLGQESLKLALPKDEFDIMGEVTLFSSIDQVLQPYDFAPEEHAILAPYVKGMCDLYEKYQRGDVLRSKLDSRLQRTGEYLMTTGMTMVLVSSTFLLSNYLGYTDMVNPLLTVGITVSSMPFGVLLERTLKPMKYIYKHAEDRKRFNAYVEKRSKLQNDTIKQLNKHYESKAFLDMPMSSDARH